MMDQAGEGEALARSRRKRRRLWWHLLMVFYMGLVLPRLGFSLFFTGFACIVAFLPWCLRWSDD